MAQILPLPLVPLDDHDSQCSGTWNGVSTSTIPLSQRLPLPYPQGYNGWASYAGKNSSVVPTCALSQWK
jgi:hypothetical protein